MISYVILITLITANSGCKKFVEGKAPGYTISSNDVFSDNASAAAVLSGIYSDMMFNRPFSAGTNGLPVITSLSADELELFSNATNLTLLTLYRNKLTNQQAVGPWAFLYNYILRVNAAIAGLANSTISSAVKNQLLGEAHFLRAFYYFYLVNLYGDVPMPLTTDWRKNTVLARTSSQTVWKQIVLDLIEAKSKLSYNYLMADAITAYPTGGEERVRPSKWAAIAMLARVYLYTGEYQKAVDESSTVISANSLFELTDLNQVFLKNSKEAIWQIIPSNNQNTNETQFFVLNSDPAVNRPVYISKFLLDSIELGDKRFQAGNWINQRQGSNRVYTYPYKYKAATFSTPVTEYLMVLRLAEQYLIRAEAKIQLGMIQGGIDDLNLIRSRARALPTISIPNPLPNLVNPNSKDAAMRLVEKERQHELFTEWGHRWFDLRRTQRLDDIMNVVTPLKSNGESWQTYQKLYPIFWQDIQVNPNLAPNNPGY